MLPNRTFQSGGGIAKLAVADGGGLDIRAPIARVSDAVQTRGDMVVIEAAAEDDAVALLDDLENLGLEHGACCRLAPSSQWPP